MTLTLASWPSHLPVFFTVIRNLGVLLIFASMVCPDRWQKIPSNPACSAVVQSRANPSDQDSEKIPRDVAPPRPSTRFSRLKIMESLNVAVETVQRTESLDLSKPEHLSVVLQALRSTGWVVLKNVTDPDSTPKAQVRDNKVSVHLRSFQTI